MRPGQQNRRGRNRTGSPGGGSSSSSSSSSSNGSSGHRKPQNALSRNYESNGPDVKIRGSAQHIAEKYLTLARDAQSSGDRIMAESYLQHAEHYNRIIMTAQSQMQQSDQQPGGQHVRPRRPEGDQMVASDQAGADDDEDVVSAAQPANAPIAMQTDQPLARQGANGRRRRARYPSDGEAGDSEAGSETSRRPSSRNAAHVPGQSEQPEIRAPKPFAGESSSEPRSELPKSPDRKADTASDDGMVAASKPAKPHTIDISKDDIVV